jgi:hypothetical protein
LNLSWRLPLSLKLSSGMQPMQPRPMMNMMQAPPPGMQPGMMGKPYPLTPNQTPISRCRDGYAAPGHDGSSAWFPRRHGRVPANGRRSRAAYDAVFLGGRAAF